MKERPILFSAPMVRALLAGTKTQTRRVITPQPFEQKLDDGQRYFCIDHRAKRPGCCWPVDGSLPPDCTHSRYGVPGDRLWVRETWRTPKSFDALNATAMAEKCLDAGYKRAWAPIEYADGSRINWAPRDPLLDQTIGRYRHPRFMPRWASRITLEITDVRVQRLQEITDADAIAEGIERDFADCSAVVNHLVNGSIHCDRYARLWDYINAKRGFSWQANPWVWALTFRRVED